MFQSVCCRLCLNYSNSYEHLYDENGLCNVQLYEITVKYFLPMFLTIAEGDQPTVLCLDCWHHISEFHNYHSAVFLAQSQHKLAKLCQQISPQPVNSDELTNRTGMASGLNEDELSALPELELIDDGHKDMIVSNTDPKWETEVKTSSETGVPVSAVLIDLVSSDESSQCGESDSSHYGEEFDDPVGVFTGGEFSQPTQLASIDTEPASADDNAPVPERTLTTVNEEIGANDAARRTSKKRSPKELNDIIARWRANLDCVICQKSHSTFSLLRSHFLQEHREAIFYISCCGSQFTLPGEIADHALFHMKPNSFKCQLCGKRFSSHRTLYGHMYQVHSMTKTGQRSRYKCSVCAKTFAAKSTLKVHMTSHMVCRHHCPHCPLSYKWRGGLNEHILKCHRLEWDSRRNVATCRFMKI